MAGDFHGMDELVPINVQDIKNDEPTDPPEEQEVWDQWSWGIPEELLLQIFIYGIEREGQLPFLSRVSQVCRRWNRLASVRDLWTRVNVSSGHIRKTVKGFVHLCDSVFGEHTWSINLDCWTCLTDSNFQVLCERCPNLKHISLAGCLGLTSHCFIHAGKLRKLETLDLSFTTPCMVGGPYIYEFVQMQCNHLQKLYIKDNVNVINFPRLIYELSMYCTKLVELDLSHFAPAGCTSSSGTYAFSVRYLQAGCPNLKLLNLRGSRLTPEYVNFNDVNEIVDDEYAPLIFPSLQYLYCPLINCREQAYILLSGCIALKFLDLSYAKELSFIEYIPNVDLTSLRLPLSIDSLDDFVYVKRFALTLQELSLEYGPVIVKRERIDNALKQLVGPPQAMTDLRRSSFCGCKISWDFLSFLIRTCRKLTFVNTVQCNNMTNMWRECITGNKLKHLYELVDGKLTVPDVFNLYALDNTLSL